MDIKKYAALNDVFVDKAFETWQIIGYLDPYGRYISLRNWKAIGKKTETAIRNIDKFKASLNQYG